MLTNMSMARVNDGRSGSHGGYAYRMIYVRPDVVDSLADNGPSFHPYVSLHFLGAERYAAAPPLT
jgi:hypothetical protein